jgi:hypothetical protein
MVGRQESAEEKLRNEAFYVRVHKRIITQDPLFSGERVLCGVLKDEDNAEFALMTRLR